jgi:hypothetical protein
MVRILLKISDAILLVRGTCKRQRLSLSTEKQACDFFEGGAVPYPFSPSGTEGIDWT